ncbi:MAG TPA: recombination mediator RecR [Patescibacteria group bacterium]|nr:recombination mediator RecR [Patescibacteria group bacterium]
MYPKSFKKLIDHFASLPSIGPKMAERLVLYLFKQDEKKLGDFSESLKDLKSSLHICENCGNISENEICYICRDQKRDSKTVCVVEDPLDVIAIERTKKYNGVYHILGGLLTPAINDDQKKKIRFSDLEKKVKSKGIKEVILATNPTTEGDATALYIKRILQPYEIKITRLARGMATGGDIEYADELTLISAIDNRK